MKSCRQNFMKLWLFVAIVGGIAVLFMGVHTWYDALKPPATYAETTCHVLNSRVDEFTIQGRGGQEVPRAVAVFKVTVKNDLRETKGPLEAFMHANRDASTKSPSDPSLNEIQKGTDVSCWQNEKNPEIVKLDPASDAKTDIYVPLFITFWSILWWGFIFCFCRILGKA